MRLVISLLFSLLVATVLLLCNPIFGQTKNGLIFMKQGDIFGTRYFIKNNGQYDKRVPSDTKIRYAFLNGNDEIYFTDKGLFYKLIKKPKLSHEEFEKVEQGEKIQTKEPVISYVSIQFINCNPKSTIIEEGKSNHYFSFGDSTLKSYGFTKLTYKTVYPFIDLEFVIPEDKPCGIKYNVILHPGANLNHLKLLYGGDIKTTKKKLSGNIVIATPSGNITEHSPELNTNYPYSVNAHFVLKGDTITFSTNGQNIIEKETVIDPWVTTLTTLTGNNFGYDVDYDDAGNLFVYGGGFPSDYKVAKYNASGSLLWTFSGFIPSILWSTRGTFQNYETPGNFAVHKPSGKCYVGTGSDFDIGATVIRLDPNGNYDNFITSPATLAWPEIWDMCYECRTSQVLALGGSPSSKLSASIINQISGSVTPQSFFSLGIFSHDIISHAYDEFTGELYWIYGSANFQSPGLNNKIAKIDAGFSTALWLNSSTYFVFNEVQNKNAYFGVLGNTSNGFNCLSVNNNYLYYYDGFHLAAYNKTTGVKLGFVNLSGLTVLQQGGIAVDDCNTVYVGGKGSIMSYNFNGTSFTALAPISLGTNNASNNVFDIKLDKKTNNLYACGNNFAGVYTAIHSLTTSPQFTVSQSCNIATATVTAPCLNGSIFSYSWTNSAGIVSVTNSSPLTSNTITGLAAGNYTVYCGINYPCGPVLSQTLTVPNFTLSITPQTITCNSPSGSVLINSTSAPSLPVIVTENNTVLTTLLVFPSMVSGLTAGTHTLLFTATNGCTLNTVCNIPTNTVSPNIGIAPYSYITCSNPTITLLGSSTNTNAIYQWINGPNGNAFPVSSIGNYTFVVKDTLTGCASTQVASVTQYTTVNLNLISHNVCFNSSVTTATAIASGGIGPYTYQWSDSQQQNTALATNLGIGIYTVSATDIATGCIKTASINIVSLPQINLSLNATKNIVCVGDIISISPVILNATPPVTYSWSNNQNSGSILVPVTGNTSFQLFIQDGNLCNATASISLSTNSLPKIDITANKQSGCDTLCVAFYATGTNLIYSWNFGDGQISVEKSPVHCYSAGNYFPFVTATDSNNCHATTHLNKEIIVFKRPEASFIPSPNPVSITEPDVNFVNTSINASLFQWNFGEPNSGNISTTTNASHKYEKTGQYLVSLIASNNFGCPDTFFVRVFVEDEFQVYIPNTFTPNDDNLNETWGPVGTDINPFNYKLLIFNRWGQEIFKTNNPEIKWDGKFKGELVKEDTYTYEITISSKSKNFKPRVLHGHVNVIR